MTTNIEQLRQQLATTLNYHARKRLLAQIAEAEKEAEKSKKVTAPQATLFQ